MRWNGKRRALLQEFETRVEAQLSQASDGVEATLAMQWSAAKIALTAAWITGAVAVLAGGLYAGKELRSRYKLKRRTPYDYYAHSGDRSELEFGVGI